MKDHASPDNILLHLLRGVASGLGEAFDEMEADARADARQEAILDRLADIASAKEVILDRLVAIANAILALRDDQMRMQIQLDRVEMALGQLAPQPQASAPTPPENDGEMAPKPKRAKRGRKASTKIDDSVVPLVPVSNDNDTTRRKRQG